MNQQSLDGDGSKFWIGKHFGIRAIAMKLVDCPRGGGKGKTTFGRKPHNSYRLTRAWNKSKMKYNNV